MIVCTSVHLEHNVSMQERSWAIGYRTTNLVLPFYQLSTNHHLCSIPLRLTYQNLGNGNLQDCSLAPPGETSSVIRCKKIKRYKIPVRKCQDKNKTSGAIIRTYIFPEIFAAYKVG